MTSSSRPKMRIVAAADSDAEAMAAFFRRTWTPTATAGEVLASRDRQRSNPVSPGEPYPTFLVYAGDEVVAYLTSLPVRFWIGGRVVPGWWAKGLMVLPDHRNGPLGAMLVRELGRQVPVLGSLAVNPPALRLFQSIGLASIGSLINRLIPLRPGRLVRLLDPAALPLDRVGGVVGTAVRLALRPGVRPLAAVGGDLAGLALRLRRGLPGGGPTTVDVLPDGVDELWAEAAAGLAAGVTRDARHFLWQYGARPEAPYSYLAGHEGGRLSGLGVLRAPRAAGDPRLRGLKVAVLSELLVAPGRADRTATMIRGAERIALELGADALLVSGTHGSLARATRGAVPVPANIHLMVRIPDATLPPLADWWITRGDGDADSVF